MIRRDLRLVGSLLAAGKVQAGMTWPQYWSDCDKRKKAAGMQVGARTCQCLLLTQSGHWLLRLARRNLDELCELFLSERFFQKFARNCVLHHKVYVRHFIRVQC